MANNVYANGREISCKAGAGKSIAAFPDVCLSPPSPPAGPVPIPYPLTAMSSDTDQGSKKVKISGKEVMLKSDSNFKKCTGDEAATKSLGMGVVTHNITGKVYFCSWSMDVKIEGANAVRHLDTVTHNHMSTPGQTPPWPVVEKMAKATAGGVCDGDVQKAEDACINKRTGEYKKGCPCPPTARLEAAQQACKARREELKAGLPNWNVKGHPHAKAFNKLKKTDPDYKELKARQKKQYEDYGKRCANNECARAMKCMLVPYEGKSCCKPGQTPHHLCDVSTFTIDRKKGIRQPGCGGYDDKKAPCVCAEGPDNNTGTHGILHRKQRRYVERWQKKNPGKPWKKANSVDCGKKAHKNAFPASGCSEACIEAQLQKGHEMIDDNTPLRAEPSGSRKQPFEKEFAALQQQIKLDLKKLGAIS